MTEAINAGNGQTTYWKMPSANAEGSWKSSLAHTGEVMPMDPAVERSIPTL